MVIQRNYRVIGRIQTQKLRTCVLGLFIWFIDFCSKLTWMRFRRSIHIFVIGVKTFFFVFQWKKQTQTFFIPRSWFNNKSRSICDIPKSSILQFHFFVFLSPLVSKRSPIKQEPTLLWIHPTSNNPESFNNTREAQFTSSLLYTSLIQKHRNPTKQTATFLRKQ